MLGILTQEKWYLRVNSHEALHYTFVNKTLLIAGIFNFLKKKKIKTKQNLTSLFRFFSVFRKIKKNRFAAVQNLENFENF